MRPRFSTSWKFVCRVLLALGLASIGQPALAQSGTTQAGAAWAPPVPSVRVVTDEAGRFWYERIATGERFLSMGVNAISDTQHQPRPNTTYYDPLVRQFKGDVKAWARSCADILIGSNFNTVASWSSPAIVDPGLLHTPNIYVAEFEDHRCLAGLRPNFEQITEARVKEMMTPFAGRSDVLGVFLDNEMPWWGKTAWDVLPTYTLLERALELDASDPARQAAIEFLKSRHGTADAIAKAYGAPLASWDSLDSAYMRKCAATPAMKDREAFTELAAEKFFSRSTAVVRRMLPGILILGTRFAGDAPESVIRATSKYCDVVAVNSYSPTPESSTRLLARYWLLAKKPLMVTEFSWRAKENQSGNPNTRGAGGVLATQQDRADKFKAFITAIAAEPMVIGYHWFAWSDQSPQGRFDGEDSNYGVVDIEHRTYDTLLSTMREVNSRAADMHRASTQPFPTVMPERRGVTYSPGQHPGRPPRMNLMNDWAGPYEPWHAADAKLAVERQGDGPMVFTYETGKEYGVGVSFRGPKSQATGRGPKFTTDLDGYEFIVLDAEIAAGVEIHLHVNEAGAGEPWKTFDFSAGDDAEAFSSLPLIGTGSRSTYRVRIADITAQSSWGNQGGQRRVDMNAVGTIGVQLMGPKLVGTAKIFDLYLER